MVSEVMISLKAWNFTDEHLNYELFYAAPAQDSCANKKNSTKNLEETSSDNKGISRVSLKTNGQVTTLDLEINGDNILDAAMKQDADLPFSCQVGVCATFKAKVTIYKVEMDVNHVLTEEEVAEGFVLTCQSYPVSNDVV